MSASENELLAMANSGASPQQIEETSSSNYLFSTLFPEVRDTAPPTDTGRIFIQKQVTIDGTFTVNDLDIQNSDHKIPTSKGMILFYPYTGVQRCAYRVGFIPAGTAINFGASYFPMTAPLGSTNFQNIQSQMIYDLELVVPYAARGFGAVSGDQLTISPNMPESFAFTINASGLLTLYSDTVPIGNTELSGYVTATANATTEDSCQSPTGAFTPVGLSQSALTNKDVVLKGKISDGVTVLIGPDVNPHFTPPDDQRHDQMSGIWAAGDNAFPTTFDASPGIWPQATDQFAWLAGDGLAAGRTIGFGAWYITPWATRNSPSYANAPIQNIQVSAIGEFDCLDINVYLDAHVSSTVQAPGWIWQTELVVQHYYATCNSGDWEAYYTSITELYPMSVFTASGQVYGFGSNQVITLRPKIWTTDQTGRGKYLGTACFLRARCAGNDPASLINVTFRTGFNAQNLPRIAVRARMAGIQSSTGPIRAMQWNSVANGQTIQVKGCINTVCVPNGGLQPFVQAAGRLAPQGLNMNATLWLQLLYKAPGEMKRVYRRVEYERLKEKFGSGFTTESLSWLLSNDAQSLGAASAAGCFQAGGLFSGLGSSLGGRLGGPLGAALGGALGSWGDRLVGAAGEFGTNAAGEFGTMPSNSAYAGGYAGGGAMARIRGRPY